MKFKYYISKSNNPYINLAIEKKLFNYANTDTIILYLWQNNNTIVIGKNQDVFAECDLNTFMEDGGIIARRCSGGGAVYHDMGNLNFSIISTMDFIDSVDYKRIVIDTLKKLNIFTVANERNDILVENRKFSGNASYNNGLIVCQHGTIMISTDIKKMNQYLTPNESKLKRNHVKSVSSRVINLSEIKQISINDVMLAMVEVVNAVPLGKIIDEKEMQNDIAFFSNKEWIFGGKK